MDSTFIYQIINPYKAVTAITQGCAVRVEAPVDGAQCCAQATSSSDAIFGIAMNSAEIGELVNIQFGGVCLYGVLGDSVPPGSFLTANASGRLVQANSGDRYVGVLLPTASDTFDGSIAEIIISLGQML